MIAVSCKTNGGHAIKPAIIEYIHSGRIFQTLFSGISDDTPKYQGTMNGLEKETRLIAHKDHSEKQAISKQKQLLMMKASSLFILLLIIGTTFAFITTKLENNLIRSSKFCNEICLEKSSFSASSLRLSAQTGIDADLSKLCQLFEAEPTDLLSLKTNPKTGIRGVYLNSNVKENDVLLKIPLDSCLRDDNPPSWLQQEQPDNDVEEENTYTVSVEGWVTRLAARLLDTQQNYESQSKAIQIWLDLLPTNLREILPIHWGSIDDDLLSQTGSRSLEMAVDSAYFARSGPIGDIMASSNDADFQVSQRQIEDALDLVQTRSCRACETNPSDGTNTPYMRVLVPIFDMINHCRDHNADFFRESEYMVVRAIKNIDANNELLINYGDSTKPAWRSLFSYGFVPLSEDIYEDDAAEITLVENGMTIEVGPTEIPFELVQYEAQHCDEYEEGQEIEFTPEIGHKIVDSITIAAKALEKKHSSENDANLAAYRSIDALRESNRRTLLACAGGLREFLEEM